jgi:hypothetical protein
VSLEVREGKGAIMMISYRLVRLIETHADTLATGLEKKVMSSDYVACFRTIPAHELRERVYEIYRHLGDWLLGKNQKDIEQRYREIGARRATQKVPLAEVIQAIVLTKENLWEFLKSEAIVDRAVEIMGELELLQMLEQFFDRAIYFAALGYQEQVEHLRSQEHELVAGIK